MITETELIALRRAIALARRGLYTTTPNPRVGAVLLQDGNIIAEGWHEKAGGAHAEVMALRQAEASGISVLGATMVVTLEPCCHQGRTPPCTDALIASGIKRLLVATADPNPHVAGQGLEQCRQAGLTVIAPEAVQAEALADYRDAMALNRGFFSRHRRGRPWMMVKMAMSLDGRTALANGHSQWITSEAARHDGQFWRARACAMLTGIGTVLKDDPQMNVRHPPSLHDEATPSTPAKGHYREPIKVVLDSLGAMPSSARILRGATVLSVGLEPTPGFTPHEYHQYWQAAEEKGRINLWAVAEELARRECNEVLVEAGPVLTGAFLEAGLVDQLMVYVAPKFLGASGKPFAQFSQTPTLDQSWGLTLTSATPLGNDVRLIYENAAFRD